MNPDLKHLIRLQEVDLAIAELGQKIAAFPFRSKALDEQLGAAKAGVESARKAVEGNQSRRKEFERKVADLRVKISKYKDQLMAVKTNDEYKAMLKEIDYSGNAIGQEEDRILVLMEEAEALDAELKRAQARLQEDQRTVDADRAALARENADDTSALEAGLKERGELAQQISPDVLAQYERVRKARGGVGLARAVQEACTVCNVRMRPQVFQEIRRNLDIHRCESCGRILYDPENLDHPYEIA